MRKEGKGNNGENDGKSGLSQVLELIGQAGNKPDAIALEQIREQESELDWELTRKLADCHCTDLGNKERFMARFGQDVVFLGKNQWMVWNGQIWDVDLEGDKVRSLVHITVRLILAECATLARGEIPTDQKSEEYTNWEKESDQRVYLLKWAFKSQESARISAIMKEIKSDLKGGRSDFDQQLTKLPVQNGTLVFDSAKIRFVDGWERSDKFTRQIATSYQPGKTAIYFLEKLAEILPDPHLRVWLQMRMGRALIGLCPDQDVDFFIGSGANGKSLLVNSIAAIMGGFCESVPVDLFVYQKNKPGAEQATPVLNKLPGARMVRSSEPETNSRLDENKLKEFTGGEEMTARPLYGMPYEFIPHCKINLSMNDFPVMLGKNNAMRRRIRVLRFPMQFKPTKEDILGQMLACPEGVLNWLIDGYMLWIEGQFQTPQSVLDETEKYFNSQDPIRLFVKTMLWQVDNEYTVKSTELYENYVNWSEDALQTVRSQTAFGNRLRDLGFVKKRKTAGFHYIGVRLDDSMVPDNAKRFEC